MSFVLNSSINSCNKINSISPLILSAKRCSFNRTPLQFRFRSKDGAAYRITENFNEICFKSLSFASESSFMVFYLANRMLMFRVPSKGTNFRSSVCFTNSLCPQRAPLKGRQSNSLRSRFGSFTEYWIKYVQSISCHPIPAGMANSVLRTTLLRPRTVSAEFPMQPLANVVMPRHYFPAVSYFFKWIRFIIKLRSSLNLAFKLCKS